MEVTPYALSGSKATKFPLLQKSTVLDIRKKLSVTTSWTRCKHRRVKIVADHLFRRSMSKLSTAADLCVPTLFGKLDKARAYLLQKFLCGIFVKSFWNTCSFTVPSVIQAFGGSFNFAGSWRATFLRVSSLYPGAQTQPALVVGNMFSDLLYQPFHCATANIRKEWIQADDIERTSDLSLEDFRERYEKPAKPVIITDVVRLFWQSLNTQPGCMLWDPRSAHEPLCPCLWKRST